jgi:hypothetical protein
MPLDLTEDERRALVELLRRTLDDERFFLAPRLAALKSILAKLGPPVPKPDPLPPFRAGTGPRVGRGRQRR